MSIFAGATAPKDLRIGNTPVQRLYMGSALVWNRTPLTVAVSPTSVSGSIGVTVPVSVTATGGTGAYSYLWKRVSGSTYITPEFPSSATTGFQCHTMAAQDLTACWRCEVSDGVHTVNSPNVQVTFSGNGGDPPKLPNIM